MMRRWWLAGLLSVVSVSAWSAPLPSEPSIAPLASDAGAIPALAYTRFTLPNGLTVVVHEDHKTPLVAVGVWYHVGSADEPAGKSGFAHLFEHLMFSGSEHHRGSYFQPFEQVGATDMNGTTSFDRTNYFETVPTTALDLALWMESDRMGYLLGAIGQHELDTQRGVVENEKRQDENAPYGRVDENILRHAFPANHPYHHDSIGSEADLDHASLVDVKQWFRSHYGAANATLVLAGDITLAEARAKVERYFGAIPAGSPVAHQAPWVTPLSVDSRGVQYDQVAQPRIIRTWVVPQAGSDAALQLDLATTVLGGGKTSRLYRRLVYQDRLVDDVFASISNLRLANQVQIQTDVKSGVDPKRVEAVIESVLRDFIRQGPTVDELERAKTDNRAGWIRSLERFSYQNALLAAGQVYTGDPQAASKTLLRQQGMTASQVREATRSWLGQRGSYTLTVLPAPSGHEPAPPAVSAERPAAAGKPALVLAVRPQRAAALSTRQPVVDRQRGPPQVSAFPDLKFPTLQRAWLNNGIPVLLVERHGVPSTQIRLLFDAGYAADPKGQPGTASFTLGVMGESVQGLDSLAVSAAKQRLGAMVGLGCGLDTCSVSLDALNEQLKPSLALFERLVRQPAFRTDDIARVRGQWLSGIAQEETEPLGLGLRVLPPLVYGAGHAYGVPLSGTGTVASIRALNAADLRQFQQHWLRPDNVQILVVGDTRMERILSLLNANFGHWPAPAGAPPVKRLAKVAEPAQSRVFLLDRPGALQSVILAGLPAPSAEAPDYLALNLANDAFGGSFTSRLNMDLREDKRWAYGAFSYLVNARGPQLLLFYAPVQTNRTAPAAAEVLKDARAVVGDRPLTPAEVDKNKQRTIRSLPGAYQTSGQILGGLTDIVTYHRPDDAPQTLKSRLQQLSPAQTEAALRLVLKPAAITWVIVGDLRKIEAPVRALQLGLVQILHANDAPGRP